MANYLFDKYNVAFGPWSGESVSYSSGSTAKEFFAAENEPVWNGSYYQASTYLKSYCGSFWSPNNGELFASKTYWSHNSNCQYSTTTYQRTRTATPTTLVQSGIVGTINQYPANGYGHDGFYYIRRGIENSPIITSPNGGESLNELFTITFSDNKPKTLSVFSIL